MLVWMYKTTTVLNMLIWSVGRVFFLIIVIRFKDLPNLVILFRNMLTPIIHMFVCREREHSSTKQPPHCHDCSVYSQLNQAVWNVVKRESVCWATLHISLLLPLNASVYGYSTALENYFRNQFYEFIRCKVYPV